jgi:glycosyltransferase involved in cell wall biosynthesis
MAIEISYIIATYNRLAFLKITLGKLLDERQPDEEIIVVDGNSTDGSKEYLQKLFELGKIHQYISELDRNQAHAWNKGMLMCRGIIIKKIIDDDVFCYKAIRECKRYMLKNPDVDVMISNDLSSSLNNYKDVQKLSRQSQFEAWSRGITPSFTFGDVHLLIRKSALANIGLYNTSFVMMDWEYSLRISYLKANIVYYTGYNALSVSHPQTVTSLKNNKLITEQGRRGNLFYEYPGDHADISLWSKIKIGLGKLIYLKNRTTTYANKQPGESLTEIYNYYYNHISELNNAGNFTIISAKQ